jgi:O-antigen/teichoic acid export membrane protein
LIVTRSARLRSGSGWALASMIVALAGALARTIVTAHYLDPSAIGLVAIALLTLGCVEAVATTGVDTALIAAGDDVDRYFDPAFTIQVTRGIAVFGCLWLAAPLAATAFGNPASIEPIRAVAAIAAIRGFANPAVALAVRRLDFRRMFWWSLPEVVSSLVLTVVLVQMRRDAWALVMATVAGQAIAAVASYGVEPRWPRLVIARDRMRELLRFGRVVAGARALMYFSVYLDATLVGLTLGTHALGVYQVAARIAELPVTTVTRPLAQVTLPAVSGIHPDVIALNRSWRAMLASAFAVNLMAAICTILLGPAVISVLAGERWLEAVPVMRILSIAMLFRAPVILVGQLFDGCRRPELTLRLNAVRLGALILLLPPLARWSGLPGIAGAVLVINVLAAAMALRWSARMLRSLAPSSARL